MADVALVAPEAFVVAALAFATALQTESRGILKAIWIEPTMISSNFAGEIMSLSMTSTALTNTVQA